MCNKNYFPLFFSISLLFVLAPSLVLAQNGALNGNILKVKSTTDFTVTGDGSSKNWKNAPWNILLQHSSKTLKNAGWEIQPQSGNSNNTKYQTAFKILYSNKGIYCLFQCEDSLITATLKGDFLNLFEEDVVEVFLRPDANLPVYFEYELSPLNFELPILILNNKEKIMGWQPWPYQGERKTIHAVKINDVDPANKRITWTAEVFIPFTLLEPINNVPPKKGTKWRGNFYRIDYDRKPVYYGWKLTRRSFHDPERFGILEFE
jgi:hypothetical protein